MSHALLDRPAPSHVPPPRQPSPLARLAAASQRRRAAVVVAWLVALGVAVGLSTVFGEDFAADYSVAGSDSDRAEELLRERFPAQSGDTVSVVVHAAAGAADEGVQADVRELLDELSTQPHVAGVDDPFTTPGGVAPDGQTVLARLRLDVTNPVDVPVEDGREMIAVAEAAERDGLDVALGGQAIAQAEQGEIGSETIGLAAAAVILLLTFGSVVAAGLPIGVAVAGLAVSGALTGALAALVDVPEWATSVSTMIGLGIGIDYALLMVTRFREWRAAGLDPQAATVATVDTAGRSVLVAGGTVVVSMLGLFAMGLSYMRGVAVVTVVAVLVVMAASVTLFPALLGYLGRHVDRLRLPLGRRRAVEVTGSGHVAPSRAWVWWSRLVDRHSVLASLAGVALLLALAAPFLGLRFGFADAGNSREETTTRQAYDMLAEGFGPGANGPLLVAVDLERAAGGAVAGGGAAAASTLGQLQTALAQTPGVAGVAPPQVSRTGDTGLLTVVPTTGPQSAETEDLVRTLRDDVLPSATQGTGAQAFVGGATAASIDSTDDVARRIPFLIAGVVALSMLLLLVSFRSVVVPVTAALMNLLSVAAAYGVVGLASEGGWAGRLVGIDTETPLPSFVPVLMFAVLFGLSMDYEVFLVSRMRESWLRHADNARAVVSGLAGTGRVITAAAAIMVAVFAAFVPSPDVMLKVIGVGMAAAILIDATIVRMLLVPAVMHLFGRANWWLPGWLDRALPQLYVEGRPDLYLGTAEASAQSTRAAQPLARETAALHRR